MLLKGKLKNWGYLVSKKKSINGNLRGALKHWKGLFQCYSLFEEGKISTSSDTRKINENYWE